MPKFNGKNTAGRFRNSNGKISGLTFFIDCEGNSIGNCGNGGDDYMTIFSSASFKRSDQKHDTEGLTDRKIGDRLQYGDTGN